MTNTSNKGGFESILETLLLDLSIFYKDDKVFA